MSNFLFKCLAAAILVVPATPALVQSQDADVSKALNVYGGLSKGDARALSDTISQRIKRSADAFTGINDPVRRSMRDAMFGKASGTPQQDTVNDAKARLFLYAGLNKQTLTALFKQGADSVANCARDFGATEPQCESLIAAATKR